MVRPLPLAIESIVVEEHVVFSFADLCRASGASSADLLALVDEGLLQPVGTVPAQWQFAGTSLRQARLAMRLVRDFELGWAGAALVMELLAEIDALRARSLTNRRGPR